MNNKPQDELLTAYLDDELAPEERADVERMLAEDASSRQLLEELKALRSTLHALPQDRLGSDFSKQVMQIAERSMLVGSSSEDGQAAISTGQQSPSPKIEVRPAADQDWRQRLLRPLAFAGLAIAAALAVMILQPAKVANQDASRGIAIEDNARRAPTLEVAPSSSGAESPQDLTQPGLPREEPAFRAPPSMQPKAAMSKGGGGGVAKESYLNGETAPPADSRDADRGPQVTVGQTAVATPDARAFNFQRSKQLVDEQVFFQSNAAAPVYSVQLDVTPAAARGRVLDKTLERNRIKVTSVAAQRSEDNEATEEKLVEGIAPIDVVYVELTKSQLESVLTDIADQPDQFSNIMVPTNSEFVGQKAMAGEAREMQFGEQSMRQGASEEASPPNASRENELEVDVDTDGAVVPESATQAPAPEGVAQRFQLPQLSARKQALGRQLMDEETTQSAEPTKAEKQEDEAVGLKINDDLGGADALDLNEQMLRALFILRVVPEINEPDTEAETPAEASPSEPENEDAEQP